MLLGEKSQTSEHLASTVVADGQIVKKKKDGHGQPGSFL